MRLKASRPARLGLAAALALAMLTTTLPAPAVGGGEPDIINGVQPLFSLTQVASGLSSPLGLTHAGDGTGRVFIIEQGGAIKVLQGGTTSTWLSLNAKVQCCGERGLLGLAFHPDFETNGVFVASYTRAGDGASVLEKFVVSNPPLGAPPANGQVLLVQSQPYSNHNGGGIKFGPDGYLYFALGDGGSAGDPLNSGQNRASLLGKMLRIDVNVPSGYAVPADNPFVGQAGTRPEIWALGLRNPWRWSFDRATGDLWIADVGQNLIEEVNRAPAGQGGQNYGWRIWEGHFPYGASSAITNNPLQFTFPVHEYTHPLGCSVTGGYLYRGPLLQLQGMYLFGDYCQGWIMGLQGVEGAYVAVPLLETTFNISSFGEDEAGNVYVVHHGGSVHRIS